jgi:hypothetical protein
MTEMACWVRLRRSACQAPAAARVRTARVCRKGDPMQRYAQMGMVPPLPRTAEAAAPRFTTAGSPECPESGGYSDFWTRIPHARIRARAHPRTPPSPRAPESTTAARPAREIARHSRADALSLTRSLLAMQRGCVQARTRARHDDEENPQARGKKRSRRTRRERRGGRRTLRSRRAWLAAAARRGAGGAGAT